MDKDCLFMRWKERFLVPDHRVEDVTGGSFAGYYYICFQLSTGYYSHRDFHRIQQLVL
ncbi:hypothetical protein K493DRAFT_391089, partial [Basidiobolus meristosporus CBS 931.73]